MPYGRTMSSNDKGENRRLRQISKTRESACAVKTDAHAPTKLQ